MVEKCLNPMCTAKFRTLRDGRVFVREIEDSPSEGGRKLPHKLAYFWLCGSCCRTMTVVTEKGTGVHTMSLSAHASADPEKPVLTDRVAR